MCLQRFNISHILRPAQLNVLNLNVIIYIYTNVNYLQFHNDYSALLIFTLNELVTHYRVLRFILSFTNNFFYKYIYMYLKNIIASKATVVGRRPLYW